MDVTGERSGHDQLRFTHTWSCLTLSTTTSYADLAQAGARGVSLPTELPGSNIDAQSVNATTVCKRREPGPEARGGAGRQAPVQCLRPVL